ncbi:MAG: MFS transporter, partial [Firmicutes bacterium]|nr:MFS transporter [Bacillota bacterium]
MDLNRVVWGACFGLIFFSAFNGATFAGFVRSLGVGDFMYGVLMALPVMGGLFQVLAAYILERTGARKKIFLISGVLQRIVVIPMVLLPFIIPPEWKPLMIGLIMLLLVSSSI